MNYLVEPTRDLQHASAPITRSHIKSVGTYLPEERVSSDQIMQEIKTDTQYGLPCDWMSKDMGIVERRFAPSNCKPSDLAIRAAQQAIDRCIDVSADEIEAVIFCGIERDQPEPATAHTIQRALGLKAHHVFDVANACYGFVDGLKLASALISSNMITNALVVTGEISTQVSRAVIDMLKRGVSQEKAKHLWGMLSVGDAGGAVILGQSFDGVSGFRSYNQRCDSRQTDRCHYRFLPDGTIEGKMEMAQIAARGFRLSESMIDQTLEMLGWDTFDWVLTHQTGRRSVDLSLKLNGIAEDKLIRTYPMLGNITTATFAMCFQRLLESGTLKSGDRIGGLFAGSGLVTGQFGYVF